MCQFATYSAADRTSPTIGSSSTLPATAVQIQSDRGVGERWRDGDASAILTSSALPIDLARSAPEDADAGSGTWRLRQSVVQIREGLRVVTDSGRRLVGAAFSA
jgi:hypothetical protein